MASSPLFESSTINGMTLANRFVRSATWEGMATEDGRVTPKLTDTMVALATGGVGLIISGHTYVSKVGQASPYQLGIYDDSLIDGLKSMTDAVHAAGGKIVAQLAHAGHFALEKAIGTAPVVASHFDGLSQAPRTELSVADIQDLKTVYVEAAQTGPDRRLRRHPVAQCPRLSVQPVSLSLVQPANRRIRRLVR